MSQEQQSTPKVHMTLAEYTERNQTKILTNKLEVSHRRNIHFMIYTDKYKSDKIVIRDGYVEHDSKIEVVGKGIEVPLKDWATFFSRMQEVHEALIEAGKISR
jgi:hypothetical protein